jgi:predicted O-methyltransferase YrrM
MRASTAVLGRDGALQRARRGVERYGVSAFAREVTTRPLHPVLAPLAGRRLRRRAAATRGTSALLDLAFGFDAFGITITPGQVRYEISGLLDAVAAERPRTILEIGTANGGSLFLVSQVAAPDAHVISVDLPHGEFGGGYPAWKIPLYRSFRRPAQRLDLVRGDSHSTATLAGVRARLRGAPLDFLFIDGDHTYEGVRQDFETYGPLVRPGGLVAFHDIAPPAQDRPRAGGDRLLVGEVPRYWQELRTRYDSRELIEPGGGGYFGIGLIRV